MRHLGLLCSALAVLAMAATASGKAPKVRIEASSSYDAGQTDRGAEMPFDG